jgi:hypothetical protein
MDKPERRVFAVVIAATLIGMTLAGCFLAAFHKPTPHGVNVGVVAPPQVVQQLTAGLDQHSPGAFDLTTYPSEAAAHEAILDRDVDGAFVASPQGAHLLVASGAGLFPHQAIETAFTAIGAATGQQVQVTDVAPLATDDPAGVKGFFTMMLTMLPSLAMGVAIALLGARVAAPRRAAALVLGAVLLGCGNALIADGLTGTLPGGYWKIAGVVCLFSFAVSATTAFLTRLHPAGAVLALLTFVALGVPPTGGPARFFIPRFFRFFDPWMPTVSTVQGLRNISYFDSHHVAGYLWVLVTWAVLGLAGLLLTGRMRHGGPHTGHGTEHGELTPAGRTVAKEA